MLALPLAGIIVFGAVTTWAMAPLLALAGIGMLMGCVRPLFAGDAHLLQRPPGGVWLGAFLVYGLLLTPFSAVPYEARIEMLRVASLVFAYWAWTELTSPHQRWRAVLGVTILVVTLVAWYALIQHSRGSNMVLFETRPKQYGLRASGTYICPNHFANLLELIVPFCAALVFTPAAGAVLRLLSGYALLLFTPALFLTQSRSGWIATVVGLGVTALCMAARRGRKLFLSLLVALPLLGVFTGTILWYTSPVFQTRVSGAILGSHDSAVGSRLLMWKDTIAMIKDAPLLGHGPSSFEWLYPKYQSHALQLYFDFPHNEYLQVLAEFGVVGLALLAAAGGTMLWVMVRRAVRSEHTRDAHLGAALVGAFLASLVHSAFDFNYHVFANTHVLIMLGGVVAGALYGSGTLSAVSTRPVHRYLLNGTSALCIIVMLLLTVQVFFSHWSVSKGTRALKAMDLDAALLYFERGTKIDRTLWRAYLGMADVEQTKSFWSLDKELKSASATAAMELYERTLALNPYALEALLGKSKMYYEMGEPEKAVETIQDVTRFAHHDRFYLVQAGLQLKRMGLYPSALEVFERAHALGPTVTIQLNLQELRQRTSPST